MSYYPHEMFSRVEDWTKFVQERQSYVISLEQMTRQNMDLSDTEFVCAYGRDAWDSINNFYAVKGRDGHNYLEHDIALIYFMEQYNQVFDLSNWEFGSMLRDTELPDNWRDDFMLPYKSFYIHAPLGKYINGVDLSGALVWDIESDLCIMPTSTLHNGNVEFCHTFKVSDVENSKADDLLKQILPGSVSRREIMNLVINLVLYINSSKPMAEVTQPNQSKQKMAEDRLGRVKSEGKKTKARRKVAQSCSTVTTLFSEKSIARSCSDGIETRVRGHFVRAHWHHYWKGSGDERKLVRKWLFPYAKGDWSNPVSRSKYVFKTEK